MSSTNESTPKPQNRPASSQVFTTIKLLLIVGAVFGGLWLLDSLVRP